MTVSPFAHAELSSPEHKPEHKLDGRGLLAEKQFAELRCKPGERSFNDVSKEMTQISGTTMQAINQVLSNLEIFDPNKEFAKPHHSSAEIPFVPVQETSREPEYAPEYSSPEPERYCAPESEYSESQPALFSDTDW